MMPTKLLFLHFSPARVCSLPFAFFLTVFLPWFAPAQQAETLISNGAVWAWHKGTNEASIPFTAWRTNGFNDSSWPAGLAPFSYGEGLASGTFFNDMQNNYRCVFLRKTFVVTNVAEVQSVSLTTFYDDGFVAWINGTNVLQVNMPTNSPTISNLASVAHEAVPAVDFTVANSPQSYLVVGTNTIAVQVFNNQIGSSDMRFETTLQITKFVPDSTPPAVTNINPAAGSSVGALTQIAISFSEPVTGVDAGDLLINGLPASGVIGGAGTNSYTFTFTQPGPGTVNVSWDGENQITDLGGNPFLAGAAWSYTITDTAAPQVSVLTPRAGAVVGLLTQVSVTFDEPVLGVDASDLLVNGQPATSVSGMGMGPYVFQFPQPTNGTAQFSWAAGNGITDTAAIPNAFAGGSWSVTLNPGSAAAALTNLVINEFLASNVDTNGLRDEDGELSDWIEIYNRGTSDVNLAGWSLTDDASQPALWTFPATNLPAGGFLIVFASDKDRRSAGMPLHASFGLGSGGDYLGLYNPELPPRLAHDYAPKYPEQRNDISYGLDGTNGTRYFSVQSPGFANGSSTLTGIVAAVHFTVKRGFFNQPFNLLLTTPTPGATIRYTTDGTPPTAASGVVYSAPLLISNTTIVRAAAFQTYMLPTLVGTHTYIFASSVLDQPTNPPGFPMVGKWSDNNTNPPDYAMDRRIITNAAYRGSITNDLLSLPTLSIVMITDDMFATNGGAYPNYANLTIEKPCSMELIYPDGGDSFQIDAGIAIHGGQFGSRLKTIKHSFGIKFKGKYGFGKMHYQMFPDSPVDEFDSIVLRADYNNHWTHWLANQRAMGGLVRDAMIKDTMGAMGDFTSHSRYVHLYINGLYWGVYNPAENVNNDFAASYFGGDGNDYDCTRWGDVPKYYGDSNHVAYTTMLSYNNTGLFGAAQYAQIQQYLDVQTYADYLILQHYAGNWDWGATKNWGAVRKRQPGAQFKMVPWDNERTFEGVNDNLTALSPENLQSNLVLNSEYKILFADRIHKHLFNDGALTPDRIAVLWTNRSTQIFRAMVCESARWGDAGDTSTNTPYNTLYTRDDHFVAEQERLLNNYFPYRTAILLNQYRTMGYYPTVDAPEFNQFGGRVASGFNLTISAPAGTIYYTTNGIDPRMPITGNVSASAYTYTGTPVALTGSRLVKARILSGSTWSALTEAQFIVGELGIPLRITEINYNPIGGDAYEFVDVQNIGAMPIDASGFSFQGINFIFPQGAIIQPGATLVLASSVNTNAFMARYPSVSVFGMFGGNLSNGGERLAILDANGQTITAVHYDDENGWPTAPDGGGYTLEIIDPRGDPDAPANWRVSSSLNGRPGLPSIAPSLGNIVINEVMADNVSTITNSGTLPDWVEIYNRDTNAVNLAGWSLTDDSNPRKFVFPSTNLAAGGYLVIWCDAATNAPGLHSGFALGRTGDNVFLFDANTNRMDGVTFGLQMADFTVGRISDTWQLNIPTPGGTNVPVTLASSTNLAINEWLANPPPGGSDWIELFNRASNAPVALQGIYLGTSNAIFQMNALSFLPPHGYVQLLADENAGADHLDFKLPASGETISLYNPATVLLEQVTYSAQTENVSQGRLPDGTVAITNFNGSASPGASNYVLAWSGPILNEVLARNERAVVTPWGGYADFIELFNGGAFPVSLVGMALGNSFDGNGRWIFPSGATIAAGGYLRVWCDSSRAASTLGGPDMNSGFSLDGNSGDVYLFDSTGQPVDGVSYGFQVSDMSIGLSSGRWQLLASPTPGAANSAAATLGSVNSIRFNEWMAGATNGDDWIELYNTNTLPVNLDGLYLSDNPSIAGITNFKIAPLSFISGNGWIKWVADGKVSAGRNHADFALDILGETLRLYDTNFTLIDVVDFGVQASGVSQGRLPDGATNIVSFTSTPTPDDSNYLPLTNIVINEVLAHTDPPLEDTIELYNPTMNAASIGGWYLSDSQKDLKRYHIPDGTTIPAGGYRVFYQNQFGPADGETDSPPLFTFNSAHGDSAFLSEADPGGNLSGYRIGVSFGASANGVSFGRCVTSAGVDFTALSQRTFGMDNPTNLTQFRTGTGLSNAYPLVGPVVINEIMYHPGPVVTNASENPDEEFIELYNLTTSSVPLFDPTHATNAWRLGGGVGFDFPTNTSIPAKGYLLIVGFDPATNSTALTAFRAKYGTNGPIVGPYSGKLDNGGDSLELYRPDNPQTLPHPDAGFVPYILVDRVVYSDTSPWPANADGSGASLQRITPGNYGNDPINWTSQTPTAGLTNSAAGSTDSDGDGMPDWWELQYGTSVSTPDGNADPDHDGQTNLQEYLAGTNPLDANSVLRIQEISLVGGLITLKFQAVSNHSYSVLSASNLAGPWPKLADVPAYSTNRLANIPDTNSGAGVRFYRLVMPAQGN